MYECFAYTYVCAPYAHLVPEGVREGVRSHGTGVAKVWEPPHVGSGSSASAEPSLQASLSVSVLRFPLGGVHTAALVLSVCMEHPFQHVTVSFCAY